MPLFTSSSSLGRLVRERTLLAFLLFLALTAGLEVLLRSPSDVEDIGGTGAEDYAIQAFWKSKLSNSGPNFDMVLFGDSRVLVGCAPQEMEQVLPGRRIMNFAFNAAGMNAEMLHRAGSLLAPDSDPGVMVLGITPHSLTPRAKANRHYESLRKQGCIELLALRTFGWVWRYGRSYTLSELQAVMERKVQLSERIPVVRVLHDTGWMESDSARPNPKQALDAYREQFVDNAISADVEQELLGVVREWRRAGVRVFGFRPPVPRDVYDLENRLSGFDEAVFAATFQEAGGVWLNFEPGSYETYDGSHLRAPAARSFSRELARRVEQWLESWPHEPAGKSQ